ncbi:uncharacterized protein B0H18DRAFT_1117937 [Fomitopsis serialis]|uniref:uncharacterized protein n=1 Tax=Fomitopsis serialis TaxID=139415 RepID=UPI0020075113|nr:uncharacterized protein B0H18DRAFT_1117937 [Neoantrodia serialis]KAH9928250.1 hypothetical protein B0H18DRAFT_1117937 [Neoantrodia serialis]
MASKILQKAIQSAGGPRRSARHASQRQVPDSAPPPVDDGNAAHSSGNNRDSPEPNSRPPRNAKTVAQSKTSESLLSQRKPRKRTKSAVDEPVSVDPKRKKSGQSASSVTASSKRRQVPRAPNFEDDESSDDRPLGTPAQSRGRSLPSADRNVTSSCPAMSNTKPRHGTKSTARIQAASKAKTLPPSHGHEDADADGFSPASSDSDKQSDEHSSELSSNDEDLEVINNNPNKLKKTMELEAFEQPDEGAVRAALVDCDVVNRLPMDSRLSGSWRKSDRINDSRCTNVSDHAIVG